MMKYWRIILLVACCGVDFSASAQSLDSIMCCRTEEYIGTYAEDLKFISEEEGFLCSVLWFPLSDAGLNELAYRGDYPYRFAAQLAIQVGKIYGKEEKGIGSATVWFCVDTLGQQRVDSVRFNAYVDREWNTPLASKKKGRKIEQTVRECAEALADGWTPIEDLTGRKYPCQCSTTLLSIGGNELTFSVFVQVQLRSEFIPQLIGEDGYRFPQKVAVRKIYDHRYEPYLRRGDMSKEDLELTKKAYRAAGVL